MAKKVKELFKKSKFFPGTKITLRDGKIKKVKSPKMGEGKYDLK